MKLEKWGVGLIHECGLYTSLYGTWKSLQQEKLSQKRKHLPHFFFYFLGTQGCTDIDGLYWYWCFKIFILGVIPALKTSVLMSNILLVVFVPCGRRMWLLFYTFQEILVSVLRRLATVFLALECTFWNQNFVYDIWSKFSFVGFLAIAITIAMVLWTSPHLAHDTLRQSEPLWWRANAQNVSFQSLYGGQFTLSTQLINSKFCVITMFIQPKTCWNIKKNYHSNGSQFKRKICKGS